MRRQVASGQIQRAPRAGHAPSRAVLVRVLVEQATLHQGPTLERARRWDCTHR